MQENVPKAIDVSIPKGQSLSEMLLSMAASSENRTWPTFGNFDVAEVPMTPAELAELRRHKPMTSAPAAGGAAEIKYEVIDLEIDDTLRKEMLPAAHSAASVLPWMSILVIRR